MMVFTRLEDEECILASEESEVDRDFGRRKFLHVGINTKTSSAKSPTKQKSVEEQVPPASDPEVYTLPDLTMRAANKQWVHPPDALSSGHIVYNVKFLGECEVECPKGTDVVRDAIRKRKFNKHIRKAEGQKTPKVELTISADGVTVQDPKTKIIRHQYPLHRISYCADDKTDKRMFTFIAKSGESNTHYCYVFDSEKCAEEITLTIGQAFDIAYRRFLDTSSKDLDMKKQYLLLQKKVQALEQENQALKRRIMELEQSSPKDSPGQFNNQQSNGDNEIDVGMTNDSMSSFLTLLPSTHLDDSTTDVYETIQEPAVGRRLENLITDSPQSVQTNGTSSNAAHSGVPAMGGLLSPPPKSTRSRSHGTPSQSTNPFQSKNGHTGGSNPFGPSESASSNATVDPFGMPEFKPSTDSKDLDRAIQNVDQELLDIQTGFSAGLSFGTEDFSLADFDPLNHD